MCERISYDSSTILNLNTITIETRSDIYKIQCAARYVGRTFRGLKVRCREQFVKFLSRYKFQKLQRPHII